MRERRPFTAPLTRTQCCRKFGPGPPRTDRRLGLECSRVRTSRLAVALAVLAGIALTASVAAAKVTRISFSAPLTMDAYSPLYSFHSIPVSTPRPISRGLYVAVVRGTASFYEAADYFEIQQPFTVMCGHALPAPMFPSAGGAGPVGNDAEFIFAQPLVGQPCSTSKLPRPYPNFQVNLGKGWSHPNLVSRRPLIRPSPTHTYTFALDARGKPISFRLVDPDTRDDYGDFRVYIRRAVQSDCAGNGHRAFFLSHKVCLADTPAVAAPRLPTVSRQIALDQSPVTRVLLSSDLPTAINGETPSGALTAQQFAAIDNTTTAATTAERSLLDQADFVSAAISRFSGAGLPAYKSTAVRFRSAVQAQEALTAELALAPSSHTPAGTTALPAVADASLPGADIITYAPGSLELLAAKGDYVLTLVAVANPQPVVQASAERLFATLLARS